MNITIFDTRSYDQSAMTTANKNFSFQLNFLEARLTEKTADLAKGSEAVCCFVNDRLNADTLNTLSKNGVKLIALRSAGYNHVDMKVAQQLGLKVVRVPEYSPYAVAEHAVALLQTLNRKIHKAYNRVHEMNFSLEGLVGSDLHGKTVGVVGTGRIGEAFARIMKGFGCHILAFDQMQNKKLEAELGLKYVDLNTVISQSDILSLHIPLNPQSQHLIDAQSFEKMKKSMILINTSRGGLVDSKALIQALKKHQIAGACLDVYEEEAGIFFSDYSAEGIDDDMLARLITFPNVLITSHQAFLTHEALSNIADTTLQNIKDFMDGKELKNLVS